jgi:hypothetical protein
MPDRKDPLRLLDRARPPDLWHAATTRAARPAPELDRPPVRRGVRATAAVAALAISALTLWLVSTAFQPTATPPLSSTSSPVPSPTPVFDGWTVSASLQQERFGPLEVSIGPLRAAKPSNAHVWIEQRFTIKNVSDRPVELADMRTSTFLGPPAKSLIAADWLCGWGRDGPNAPIEVGTCAAVLLSRVLQPGESVSRPISLFKELPSMSALTAGSYRFRQPIGYTYTGHQGATTHETSVTITYSITAASD